MFFTYSIQSDFDQQTIDAFLRHMGYSRRLIIELKQSEDGILRNECHAFTNARLHTGDLLTIHLPEEIPSEKVEALELPFPVLYEDEHILVVDKPADMPIHPSVHNYGNTLANAAAFYFQKKGMSFVFRCINRLDRDTTGLVLLAKHALSGSILSQDVKDRKIHREYLAVCEGVLTSPGTIDLPIGRLPGSAVMRCIDPEQGKRAVTHYTPITSSRTHTLLRIQLETGRTHQIRVHMKAIGHPLPGDYLYHPVYDHIGRQPLHSSRLTFSHPITGETLCLEAPLPDDMKQLFDTI